MVNDNLSSQLKTVRMLSMFERLSQGAVLRKTDEAKRFNVNEKSIQRDIEDLRLYLAEHHPQAKISYQRDKGGYVFDRADRAWLTKQEILGISKILLESRAFERTELQRLLGKLSFQCNPDERHVIQEIIRNEVHHYVPVRHQQTLLDKLWDLSAAIREHKVIEIEYQRVQAIDCKTQVLHPVGIMFSEYYFYLLAYGKDKGYEFPTVYRVDRIHKYQIWEEPFRIPESERFEEGQFRKQVQFMQTGQLLHVTFRFWGTSLEAMLDRLPTATVLSQDERGTVLKATVYGRGIKMWLLSQAQFVEVIGPRDFRAEMQKTILQMLDLYST